MKEEERYFEALSQARKALALMDEAHEMLCYLPGMKGDEPALVRVIQNLAASRGGLNRLVYMKRGS